MKIEKCRQFFPLHENTAKAIMRNGMTVKMPITDTLDLHAFSPSDLQPLLEDYLEECLKAGIHEIRIIHGKGKGVQRRRVQSLLSRSAVVESYQDADPGGGGWGATIAYLKRRVDR